MWDLALDGTTGDFMFGPTHDLIGTSREGLVKQRILIRCKIPRGSFVYDTEGTLGSRLNTVSNSPSARSLLEAPALVIEALQEMDDIQVLDVISSEDEQHRLIVDVKYQPVISDLEVDQIQSDPLPESDARVTY